MSGQEQYQLSEDAAKSYARQKVPAIFAPLAEATLNAISLPKHANVLDVACGTGAVARAVAERLTEPSSITGVDLNPAMIEIARSETPVSSHAFEWIVSPADALPFDGATFSLVFCQQGLQFFPDKPAALAEIRRVIGSGGRLILSCWAAVPPFFEVVATVLGRHFGEAVAARVVAPFGFNDGRLIRCLILDSGFDCPSPTLMPVIRRMSAEPEAMREEILASRSDSILRAAGDMKIAKIVDEILQGVAHFRKGDALVMPQQAHLLEAVAM